jgi:hypothetical protein
MQNLPVCANARWGEIFEKLLIIRVISYRKLGGNFSTGSFRRGEFSIFAADSAPLLERNINRIQF